jgi:hypothetical protein
MGEPVGEGIEIRCELGDEERGVAGVSSEADDAVETDRERPRPKREAMGIGSEW